MSNKYVKRKSDQLGIPFGTAQARLKKEVFFKLVQETKKDVCFRCNKIIEKSDELSVEHKLPWQNVDIKLFWDLDNIAFSHLSCNIINGNKTKGTRIYGAKRRKIGDEGYSWCTKCQKFLLNELFSKNKARWNGLQHRCKECSK